MASAGYAAAIESGELQGAISTNPWSAKQLTDAGGVVIVDGTDDAVIEEIIGSASYELFTVIASDELIASNPDLVRRAVNAMAKAIQWMQTASAEEIAENLKPLFDGATEEELLYDAQFDKDRQVATTDGYHTDSGFQAAINLTKLADGITGDPTADQIFDETFPGQGLGGPGAVISPPQHPRAPLFCSPTGAHRLPPGGNTVWHFGELLLLAVGLSMDAFAVAICKGLSIDRVTGNGPSLWAFGLAASRGSCPLAGCWALALPPTSPLWTIGSPLPCWSCWAST